MWVDGMQSVVMDGYFSSNHFTQELRAEPLVTGSGEPIYSTRAEYHNGNCNIQHSHIHHKSQFLLNSQETCQPDPTSLARLAYLSDEAANSALHPVVLEKSHHTPGIFQPHAMRNRGNLPYRDRHAWLSTVMRASANHQLPLI